MSKRMDLNVLMVGIKNFNPLELEHAMKNEVQRIVEDNSLLDTTEFMSLDFPKDETVQDGATGLDMALQTCTAIPSIFATAKGEGSSDEWSEYKESGYEENIKYLGESDGREWWCIQSPNTPAKYMGAQRWISDACSGFMDHPQMCKEADLVWFTATFDVPAFKKTSE